MNSFDSIEENVQTGIRLEKRTLKVLKAIAEYDDQTPSELLEMILLHAYDGINKAYFDSKAIERIRSLKSVYGLDEPLNNTGSTPNNDGGDWTVLVENFGGASGVSRHRTNTEAYDYAMRLVRKSSTDGVKMRRGGVQGNGRRWDSRDQHDRSIVIHKAPVA